MPDDGSGIAWQAPAYDPGRHKCPTCGRGWASATAAAWCCTDDED